MASALKRGIEKRLHYSGCEVGLHESTRQDKNVGIVVGTGQTGQLDVPAQRGSDALMLVERHGYAVARSAYCDSRIDLAALYG